MKLTNENMKALDKHVYRSKGTTISEYFLQGTWDLFMKPVPIWLSPNVMTFLGLFLNIVMCFVTLWFSPTATDTVPERLCYYNAISLFIYQSLDVMDGKQARKLDHDTPVEELSDHGCDSITAVCVYITLCSTILFGRSPWYMLILALITFSTFYSTHWEAYCTEYIRFGKIDVMETQIICMVAFVLTGVFGPEFWYEKMTLYEMNLSPIDGIGIAGCTLSFFKFITLLKVTCWSNSATVAGTSNFSPLFNLVVVIGFAITIARNSSTMLLEMNPCLYIIYFGLIFSKLTHRIVVAKMTETPLDMFDSAWIGPVLLLLNQYFVITEKETLLLWICIIYFVIFDFLKYLIDIHLKISRYLGQTVFSVPRYKIEKLQKLH